MSASFRFSGEVAASKSLLNRLLILQSFAPALRIHGDSKCDDVVVMKAALPLVLKPAGISVNCGAAGTTFRFLALRASRIPGRHVLTGSPRLLGRPQEGLVSVLAQLGCKAEWTAQGLAISGEGWLRPSSPLHIDRSVSSQFASALVLNSWDLEFDLECEALQESSADLANLAPSQSYLDMTLQLARRAGLQFESSPQSFLIPKNSKILAHEMIAEPDLSSAFAICAMGALAGEVAIHNWPGTSLQPDVVFPEVLALMGAEVARVESTNGSSVLCVKKAVNLRGLEFDLRNSPDLFPVLAVLCGFAEGVSKLHGAPHLAFKESSRIAMTASLLTQLGCRVSIRDDGLEVFGGFSLSAKEVQFDPQDDHRLAMAAALARLGGLSVEVLHPHVVNKSFPEFWEIFRNGLNSPDADSPIEFAKQQ